MGGNSYTAECEEILEMIKKNNGKIDHTIRNINLEIERLTKELELSESRRVMAENMVSQIKSEVSTELQNAYKSGYNAALLTTNPQGGTTISNENDKKLVLSNQN